MFFRTSLPIQPICTKNFGVMEKIASKDLIKHNTSAIYFVYSEVYKENSLKNYVKLKCTENIVLENN